MAVSTLFSSITSLTLIIRPEKAKASILSTTSFKL